MKNFLSILVFCLPLISVAQTWDNPSINHSELYFNVDGPDPSIEYNLSTGFRFNSKSGGDMIFMDGGSTTNLVIDGSNGFVGIGTATPNYLLEARGKALFSNVGGETLLLNPDGNNRRGIISSNFELAFIADKINSLGSDKKIVFGAGGETPDDANFQTYMMINQGKVGIGTTDFSGTHKLRVEGSIGAREIKVEAFPNWSDFVFEKDYELPTLIQVEKYIKEKGHLKNIPSADEVKEDGIYLGQMDAKLLQKIEELTLYLIEQNKEIEELKMEVSALKHR